MKEVKPGDTVPIDGVEFRFDEGSSEAFNIWNELLEEGEDETNVTIHLHISDRRGGENFPPSKIKRALEKVEWNKTPHGL